MSYRKKSDNPPILLHMDWSDMLLKLSDADVGYIIKGMLLHRLDKELESREVDPILEGLLSFMNTQSDREAQAYIERCEKNALKRKGVTSANNSEPQLTTVNHSKPQLTTVNERKPQLTSVNNNNNNNNNNYSNNNSNSNSINTSFSSNEEKGLEKETKKEDGCPDAGADGSVDPTQERGNPNFDLRKSYLAIKKRKEENYLKTGKYE